MFDEYSEFPTYNIKAVTRKTGVTAPTLRAWERRYSVLKPTRSSGNYRLYSERDIAILQWLSERVHEGMSISGAVALLEQKRKQQVRGGPSHPAELAVPVQSGLSQVTPPEALAEQLRSALARMSENEARLILADAHAMYPLEDVCTRIIAPTLVMIGDDWHQQLISTVNEHYATQFLLGRLYSYLNVHDCGDGPLVLVGCAQGERHEIGALMMVLLLRRKGCNARYLGADVPSEDLIQTIWQVKPRVVILSAMMPESTQVLSRLAPVAGAYPGTYFMLGGRAFRDPGRWAARAAQPNLTIIGTDLQHGIQLVESLLA